jgi:hypothetical protein
MPSDDRSHAGIGLKNASVRDAIVGERLAFPSPTWLLSTPITQDAGAATLESTP